MEKTVLKFGDIKIKKQFHKHNKTYFNKKYRF